MIIKNKSLLSSAMRAENTAIKPTRPINDRGVRFVSKSLTNAAIGRLEKRDLAIHISRLDSLADEFALAVGGRNKSTEKTHMISKKRLRVDRYRGSIPESGKQ
jgi:hypothetical protein